MTTATDLIPTTTTLVGMPLMTAEEARATVDRVKRGIDTMRSDLLELYEREGWKALGYSSWRLCAVAEFGSSTATLYRQLEAAEIERDVKAHSQVENSPPIPTQQLQAVKHLPPEQRAEAFTRADQLAGGKPRTVADVAAAAAELAPLPPLGEPLRHEWVRFRDDGTGQIVMRHQQTAYTINGRDVATLETEARAAGLFLDELATFHWRVFVDVSGDGYTAQHQQFEPIAAPTIERLSLAAWRARLFEDNYPDMPDDVIDALYLQGWRWGGLAWAKGFERIEEDAKIDELRFQLGLTTVAAAPAAIVAHLPPDWADAQKRAKKLGLYLDMNVRGEFSITNETSGRGELADGVTDFQIVLARLASRETYLGAQAPVPESVALGIKSDFNQPFFVSITVGDQAAFLAEVADFDRADYAAEWPLIGAIMHDLAERIAGAPVPAAPPAPKRNPLPTRPRPPRDAGVSAQSKYTSDLEAYTRALEARLGITQ